MKTLKELLPAVEGMTKKEIAIRLDAWNPLFNYSKEDGMTSYKRYTRNELLITAIKYGVDLLAPREVKTSLLFKEMDKNRIAGFNITWLNGTDDDGEEFSLSCGAGCGSAGIWFNYKGKRYSASIREVIEQLANQL